MERPGRSVEEIDMGGQPQRSRGRDALLAGLLLGPLLLFGLGDWAHQQARADSYRQGVAAVAGRHWAAARAAYAAAGDYADAPTQAGAATVQVQALVQAYARLDADTAGGDLLQTWQDARAVAQIQPDYQDIGARLAGAEQAVFARGAQGTIYLQTSGLPGLYLIDADGTPVYLPGSTAGSHVYAIAPQGDAFLYDADPVQIALDTTVCQPGAEHLQRAAQPARMALVRVSTAGAAAPVLLPPAFTPAGVYWLTAQGLWSADPGGPLRYYDPARGRVAIVAHLDRSTRVAAVAGDQILLATDHVDSRGVVATVLTRWGSDGQSRGEVTLPGFLLTAGASPDGRYATALAEESGTGITRTLYLLDGTAPDRAPRVLDQIAWRGVILAAQLRATFVPGTPTTQLVVEHQDDRGSDVWRYDLPAAGRTLLWHGHDTIQRDEQSSLGASGQALAFRVQLDSVPALAWVPLAPRLPAGTLPIHSFGNQLVDTWFAPHSAFVVFRVRNPEGLDKGTTEDVWSVPAPPPPGAAPQLLAIARRVYDPTFPTLALPASGALALTIAPDTGLHARTLDGAADRVLAMGVEGVWALTSGR